MTLKIRFIINIQGDKSPNGPLFHRFLPDGVNNAISKDGIDYVIKFWFEQNGYQTNDSTFIIYDFKKKDFKKEDISKQAILDGGYLFGEIELLNVKKDTINSLNNNTILPEALETIGKSAVKTIQGLFSKLCQVEKLR